jgi:hypothetical protein
LPFEAVVGAVPPLELDPQAASSNADVATTVTPLRLRRTVCEVITAIS